MDVEIKQPLRYKDLWYGDLVEETNDEFEKHHIVDLSVFKTVFTSLGFKILTVFKQPRGSVYFAKLAHADKKFNVIFETLKHSGSKDNRIRAHISPKVVQFSENENEEYFLFGGYNTGDDLIFVIGNITGFIKKTQIQKNNSSFWIGSIGELVDISKNQELLWYRLKDKVLLQGVTLSKLKKYSIDKIVDKFFVGSDASSTIASSKTDEDEIDNYNIEPKEIDVNEIKKLDKNYYLPRNLHYRDIALEMANYTCELCGKNTTFESVHGKEYFEGHHLIMYNVSSQSRFDKSLDIPRNIICLCPECHKKIHYSKDVDIRDMLVKLFLKHRDLFRIYEIDSLDEILKDYVEHREENIVWE